jgi:hypothetical protein
MKKTNYHAYLLAILFTLVALFSVLSGVLKLSEKIMMEISMPLKTLKPIQLKLLRRVNFLPILTGLSIQSMKAKMGNSISCAYHVILINRIHEFTHLQKPFSAIFLSPRKCG